MEANELQTKEEEKGDPSAVPAADPTTTTEETDRPILKIIGYGPADRWGLTEAEFEESWKKRQENHRRQERRLGKEDYCSLM